MFDELQNDFKEILECGHTGVLLALAQTCKRLTAKQSSFVKVAVFFNVNVFFSFTLYYFPANDASNGLL